MTKEAALKHIKGAWVIGFLSAGVTLLVTVLAVSGVSILAEMGFDWWALLDVAILVGLSIGVYRKSRIAAVLLLTYFVASKIYMWATLGSVRGVPLALAFGYFFVQGIRGTFAYHALPPEAEPPAASAKPRKWLWVLGGSVAVLTAAVMALLVYSILVGPDTKVVPGPQVPQEYVSQIRGLGLLDSDEQIRFFYSDGFLDIEEGFYLFTDHKVVVYKMEFEQPAVIVPFSTIKDMDMERVESMWEASQISLTLDDDSVVWFPVSNEDGGDKEFFKALRETWETHSQNANE